MCTRAGRETAFAQAAFTMCIRLNMQLTCTARSVYRVLDYTAATCWLLGTFMAFPCRDVEAIVRACVWGICYQCAVRTSFIMCYASFMRMGGARRAGTDGRLVTLTVCVGDALTGVLQTLETLLWKSIVPILHHLLGLLGLPKWL